MSAESELRTHSDDTIRGSDPTYEPDEVIPQQRLTLTAHPLQRVGAYALAVLAHDATQPADPFTADDWTNSGPKAPGQVPEAAFEAAVGQMTQDALRAAYVRDTKAPNGFWLKCSLSFFPNAPMNHNSISKKSNRDVESQVLKWRRLPAREAWPKVACVLCSRAAVGFYGKADVALAESDLYRNSTPRGHGGMALCWPCLCSFYALPYGCRLTGGPSMALHSWDDHFVARTVAAQVRRNRQVFELGRADDRPPPAPEVLALRALRHYEERLRSGVELLVFGNNNRGQVLQIHSMDQVLAEWLRTTAQSDTLRNGYRALLRAHRNASEPGVVRLARDAFRRPNSIVTTAAHYLAAAAFGASAAEQGRKSETHGDTADRARSADRWRDVADLSTLCLSYVKEVLGMDAHDLDEITSTASRVAVLLAEESSGGKLTEFYARFKDSKRIRAWLQRAAVDWVLVPREGANAPLLSTRGFELLFDPDINSQAWFNRQMLLVAVVQELYQRGWRPDDGKKVAEEIREQADELDAVDDAHVRGEEDL